MSEVLSGRAHSLTVWCLQKKRGSSKQKGKAGGTGWPYWPYLGCKLREVSPIRLGLERAFHLTWGAVGLKMLLSGGVSQAFAKPGFDHRKQGILGGVEWHMPTVPAFRRLDAGGSHVFNTLGDTRARYMAEQSRVLELSLPTHNPSPGSQVRRRF